MLHTKYDATLIPTGVGVIWDTALCFEVLKKQIMSAWTIAHCGECSEGATMGLRCLCSVTVWYEVTIVLYVCVYVYVCVWVCAQPFFVHTFIRRMNCEKDMYSFSAHNKRMSSTHFNVAIIYIYTYITYSLILTLTSESCAHTHTLSHTHTHTILH